MIFAIPLADSPPLEYEPLSIQVIHPGYTTEAQLAEWLERIEVRTDQRYDQLRWSTLDSALDDIPKTLLIRFGWMTRWVLSSEIGVAGPSLSSVPVMVTNACSSCWIY